MKVIFFRHKYKKIYIILILFSIILSIILSSFVMAKSGINRDNNIQEQINNITKSNEKVAYLTFDDGPSKKETAKILDILKEENVKATFFVIGRNVKDNPELTKRAYEEGHYIANHSYYHNNSILYKSSENFISEIKNTDLEIGKAIGIPNYCSHLFRFPNGFMSPAYKNKKKECLKILQDLDYAYIDWNCLNKDSEVKISNYQLINNLKNTSKDKTTLIILMHDTGDVNNSSEVLTESIKYLKQEGYQFKNMYDVEGLSGLK